MGSGSKGVEVGGSFQSLQDNPSRWQVCSWKTAGRACMRQRKGRRYDPISGNVKELGFNVQIMGSYGMTRLALNGKCL